MRWAVLAGLVLGLALVALGAWRTLSGPVERWSLREDVPAGLASPTPPVVVPSAEAIESIQTIRAIDEPVHLFAPDLDINAPIEAKPTTTYENPFTGSTTSAFGIPDSPHTTTWWSDGPGPGADGLAILLGHSEIGRKGVFDQVETARPGTIVAVQDADGRVLRFQVTQVRTGIPKRDSEALRRVLEDPPVIRGIALVTCSGSITAELHSHDDNAVAFAELVDELPTRP